MLSPDIQPAAKIRLARTARNFTLRDLAQRVKLSIGLLSLFESGREMTPQQYSDIQAALGYDLESEAASAAFAFFFGATNG